MIKLKKIQSDFGRYNWFSNDKTVVFKVGIFKDDVLLEYKGTKALIEISEDDEDIKDELDDAFDELNIDEIVERGFAYANRVISSTNYEKQCYVFIRFYNKYLLEIIKNFYSEKIEKEENVIKEAKETIHGFKTFLNESVSDGFVENERENLLSLVSEKTKWIKEAIKSNENDIKEFVEGSEKKQVLLNQIQSYKNDLKEIELIINYKNES